MKAGESAFFQEAEKLGLERDDDSKSLDRLKVSEGKPRPSNEELRNLNVSAEKFGSPAWSFRGDRNFVGCWRSWWARCSEKSRALWYSIVSPSGER